MVSCSSAVDCLLLLLPFMGFLFTPALATYARLLFAPLTPPPPPSPSPTPLPPRASATNARPFPP